MVGSWGASMSSGMSLSLKAHHLSEGKNHRPGGLKNQVRFFPRNSVFNCFSVSEASGVFAFVLIEILKGLMVWVWAFTGSLLTRKSRQP